MSKNAKIINFIKHLHDQNKNSRILLNTMFRNKQPDLYSNQNHTFMNKICSSFPSHNDFHTWLLARQSLKNKMTVEE